MSHLLTAGLIVTAFAFGVAAQDWYHEREERFRGEQLRSHLFAHVRTDLEHVWSGRASDKERARLQRTEEEFRQNNRIKQERSQPSCSSCYPV